jgi:hypothetical protein
MSGWLDVGKRRPALSLLYLRCVSHGDKRQSDISQDIQEFEGNPSQLLALIEEYGPKTGRKR